MRLPLLLSIGLAVAACPGSPAPTEGEAEGEGEGEGEGAEGEGDVAEGEGEAGEGEGDIGEGEGEGEGDTGEGEGEGDTEVGIPYDELRQKSAHNAFQRDEAIVDILGYDDMRSLEFDIHRDKSGFTTTPGEWFVFHDDNDTGTTCHRLSDCLGDVMAFHRAAPNHEPITLFIDVKSGFTAADGHGAADLDDAFERALGDALFASHSIVDGCAGASALRDAVTTCGWPDDVALRGKILLVLTGGRACGLGGSLDTYANGNARDAFVAPQLDATCGFAEYDAHPRVAFFNVAFADRALASGVRGAGLVSRVFDVNDEPSWDASLAANINIIATDQVNINEDPYAITHQANGFPFSCFNAADCAGKPIDVAAVSLIVDSADIESTSDNFAFLREDRTGSLGGTISAQLSTENSHVQEFAKGCLMARASGAANAAYVAVCRPADNHALRAQNRSTAGASTTVTEGDIAPTDTVDEESVAWARLVVDADGLCATAQGSVDGVTFKNIKRACTDVPMKLQGLAAASHDGGSVRFTFVGPTRDGAALDVAALGTTSAIGTVRSHRELDGVVP